MALCRQVQDRVKSMGFEQFVEQCPVLDVPLDKMKMGVVFHVLQIGQVAGIGQGVQVHHLRIGVGPKQTTDHMGPDEPRSSRDEDGLEGARLLGGLWCSGHVGKVVQRLQ